MNVLIIGSGGRESALAWSVSQSKHADNLYIIPGNGGTLQYGDNIFVDVKPPYHDLIEFARDAEIGMTIVGPEAPLVDGIVDAFQEAGLAVMGPSKAASQLEGSKAFMKKFAERHKIPTADFKVFHDHKDAFAYVNKQNRPFVVKTDGLAAGKGAIVNTSVAETLQSINRIMVDGEFGAAGRTIVVEELLKGPEVSVFIVTDGRDFVWLASAQDHKRINDNDQGPNTGGMGAYAPAPFLDDNLKQQIIEETILPTLEGMRRDGHPYTGILYFGLMLTKDGPKLIEYNVRFGDPEAQVVMPLLKTDFIEVADAVVHHKLKNLNVELYSGYCTGVVMASPGYPGAYTKGHAISGDIKDEKDCFVFHAGTDYDTNGSLITTGGRVLCVSARGSTLQESIDRAYDKVRKIHFEGAHYRRDIGAKGLEWFKNNPQVR